MTREEAINVIIERHKLGGGSWEERSIDVLVGLGLLELDGPKSLSPKITDALRGRDIGRGANLYRLGPDEIWDIQSLLDKNGFRIVEK